jgi:hypothetical protein
MRYLLKRKIAFVPGLAAVILASSAVVLFLPRGGVQGAENPLPADPLTVFAYNELGMHCMNRDFSELMVLPPFNNLRAEVIARRVGDDPKRVTSGVTLNYALPANTHSADKTNFWTYAHALLGANLPPNIGLAGKGLTGTMTIGPMGDWEATGIPLTPILDNGRENPYPLATVTVVQAGTVAAHTQAVVPVSWEMACNLCHTAPNMSVATNILRAHDQLHGTTLEQSKPVLCAGCHADPALGAPGQPGISTLSAAMHGAHAPRMDQAHLTVDCYACHPGVRTNCLRDVHYLHGQTCHFCHGDMYAVGNPNRAPWSDEPRCGDCHSRTGFQFEQPGKLFKQSVGHGGVHCMACHNSTHAVWPATTPVDNLQPLTLQGHNGPIDTCTLCHSTQPGEAFFHSVGD